MHQHWESALINGLQVYALEKVLSLKKDTVAHVIFLEEAMKVSMYFFDLTVSMLICLIFGKQTKRAFLGRETFPGFLAV